MHKDRKVKQLNINDKTFKNKDGSKTRIELLLNGKIIEYKKELWKEETLELFSKINERWYGKMYTQKKILKELKNKTKKKNTKKKTTIILKRKTLKKKSEKNKTISITKSLLDSYSPTINKEIEKLSISPHFNIMGKCNENQIYITTHKKSKCVNWKSSTAKKYLLDNLKTTKKINSKYIRGPFQNRANCWFNTFFMMFFISDKGRKFMKAFRESMITGKFKTTGKTIKQDIRYPFWLLNKMITASLIGCKDPDFYWYSMDTNRIIEEIYNKLKDYNTPHIADYYSVKKPGESGNPIVMFLTIFHFFSCFLNTNVFGINHLLIDTYSRFSQLSDKKSKVYNTITQKKPHIIIIKIFDKIGENGKIPRTNKNAKVKDYDKKIKYKIGEMGYNLDSIGIRDTKQNHICALVTLNNKDYNFDGENSITINRGDWKKNINKNKDFKITQNVGEVYNFTKSYQCLLYYRVK